MTRRFLSIALFSSCVAAASGDLAAQPPAGSQLPPDENACATCHGEADLWEGDTLRLFLSKESLAEDIHFLQGVNCHDCHGGNPESFEVNEAHATEDGFRALEDVKKSCAACHEGQKLGLVMGVHAEAQEKDQQDHAAPLDCDKCHREKAHGMLSVRDRRSPVFLDNQVRLCGACHERALGTYNESVHGHGLVQTGLVSEEELREERPEYLERMRRAGKLDQLRATAPPRDVLLLTVLGGFVALAIGLALLAGILLAVLGG